MSIEEKAKAYDEALKRAKVAIDIAADKDLVGGVVRTIFPEFSESEDERIRKAILAAIRQGLDTEKALAKYNVTYDDVEAWLEKQKEIQMPNSTELIEMWHKEEAMLREKDFRGDTWRIAYNAFMDGFARGTCVKFEKQKEQKPLETPSPSVIYTEQGDVLAEQKPISQEDFDTAKHEALWEEQKPNSTEDMPYIADEHFYERAPADSFKYKLAEYMTKGCTKKEGPYGYTYAISAETILKMAEEELLKRGVVQKPAEWSEEDEEMWMDIKSHMIHGSFIPFDKIEWIENRLKSLRPSWKPSEEQMEALESEIKYCYACGLHEGGRKLQSLYEQLKKL